MSEVFLNGYFYMDFFFLDRTRKLIWKLYLIYNILCRS